MNLEDIVLSERSQFQEDKYCMSPLRGDTENNQIYRGETTETVSRQGGGGGSGERVVIV